MKPKSWFKEKKKRIRFQRKGNIQTIYYKGHEEDKRTEAKVPERPDMERKKYAQTSASNYQKSRRLRVHFSIKSLPK